MARGGYRPGAGRKPKPKTKGDKAPAATEPADDPHGDKAWLEAKRKGALTPGRAKKGLTAKPTKTIDDEEAEERARIAGAIAAAREPAVHEPEHVHRAPVTRGRPSKFKPEFVGQAEKLCKLGATDFELGEFFEVDQATIRRWKHEHEEFCTAIKSGKEQADERVERSLYHKATGYTYEAVKIFMPANASAPVYAAYTEHVPPDTTAGIFWLKNRRPDLWRDKREVAHSGSVGGAEDLTDAQLAAIIASGGDGASEEKEGTHGADSVH